MNKVRAAFAALARHRRFLSRVGIDFRSYLKIIRSFADTTFQLCLGNLGRLSNHVLIILLSALFRVTQRYLAWRI